MTIELLHGPRSQRLLAIGLGLIAAILIVQGVINGVVTQRAETRALKTYSDSLTSIECLMQIGRDMGLERILVDEHIFEHEAVNMALIEQQLSDLDRQIEQTSGRYEHLIELPNEANLWQRVQTRWGQFEIGKGRALVFSRKFKDFQARAAMLDVRDEFQDLQSTLDRLLTINQEGADQAVRRVAALQRSAQDITWALRAVGLLLIVALGFWGTRRIDSYERRILAYSRVLEERNRDLDAFAGRVAHDLKNALAPAAMTPALLRRSPADPARVVEIADRSDRSLQRSIGIVDALLALSRGSGDVRAEESASLVPVLNSVLEELSVLAGQLDVSITVETIPDVRLRCDPGLLHIVLTNVCGNAIKYLAGRKQKRVRISAREEGAACLIEVEDTGPGIPRDALEKIFEPFYRVAGTRAPGTGIGLATVRRVVDARGGRVAVESVEGRGSRFQVWLPLAVPAVSSEEDALSTLGRETGHDVSH